MRKYFFSPHFEHMNPSFWQTGFVSLSSGMVVKSNSFFNLSHSLHINRAGFSGRDSSSSEFADILTHNFGIPLLPVFGSYVSLTFLILTPFKYHFKSIQETPPDNKIISLSHIFSHPLIPLPGIGVSKYSQLKITLFLILKIHKCINKYVGVSKEGIG